MRDFICFSGSVFPTNSSRTCGFHSARHALDSEMVSVWPRLLLCWEHRGQKSAGNKVRGHLCRRILSGPCLMPDDCLSATINHFLSTCFISPLEGFPEHSECQFCRVKWGAADPNPRVVVAESLAASARPAAKFDEHAIRYVYTHSVQPKIQQQVQSIRTIPPPGGGQRPKERSPLHCLHFDGKGGRGGGVRSCASVVWPENRAGQSPGGPRPPRSRSDASPRIGRRAFA